MSRNVARHAVVAGALVLAAVAGPDLTQASEVRVDRSSHQARVQGAIQAPEAVDPGQAVTVSILDGKTGGRLELWRIADDGGKHERLGSVAVEGSRVAITAPGDPGSYRLRYVSADGRARASQPLEVTALPIVLSVPEQMRAGREAEVRWRGPAGSGDLLRIVDPDSGAVLSEVAATGSPGLENLTVLPAPDRTGDFILEYRSREPDATLRRLPISVTEG